MDAATRFETIASALADEGYTTRLWKGQRLYVSQGRRDLGYLTADDDGSTGTCRHVQRSGDISRILREALAAH